MESLRWPNEEPPIVGYFLVPDRLEETRIVEFPLDEETGVAALQCAKALAERTKMDADLAAQRSARDKTDAEAASLLALKMAGEKSEHEKQELRNKLVTQLNLFLDTRDSARGPAAAAPPGHPPARR